MEKSTRKTHSLVHSVSVGLTTLLFVVYCNGQAEPFTNYSIAVVENAPTSPGPLNITNTVPRETLLNRTTNLTEPTTLPPQRPPPALGLACNKSSDCKANFSNCVDNICKCQPDFISSRENFLCLKVVNKLGESCSDDIQCSQGLNKTVGPTTCLNFICSCAIGMSLIADKCQGPTVLNSNCSSDDDCLIHRSTCKSNMCVCRDGYVPNSENNMCLSVNIRFMKEQASRPGCAEDVQCQETMGDNAICVVGSDGGSCECTPATHLFKSSCIPYKDLGDACSFDEECITKDFNTESETSRICNQNKCSCNSGWTMVNDICTGGASQNTIAGSLIALLLCFWLAHQQQNN